MKHTRTPLTIAALLLLTFTPLAAQDCCPPDRNQWKRCGDLEVGAHALFLQPVDCRWEFARRTDPEQRSTIATVEPTPDWGFRIWAAFTEECEFASVSYQRLEARDNGRLTGDRNVAIATNGFSGSDARGHQFWRYQTIDLRAGGLLRWCQTELYGFVNGRWVDLELSRTVGLFDIDFGAEGIGTLLGSEEAHFRGGAIGLGVGARHTLFCDTALFGELNLLGAIGTHRTTAAFTTERQPTTGPLISGTNTAEYSSPILMSPELDLRVGLAYTHSLPCVSVVFEVGYELTYFWDIFDLPSELNPGIGVGADAWITECQDTGFSGLFFGARALF